MGLGISSNIYSEAFKFYDIFTISNTAWFSEYRLWLFEDLKGRIQFKQLGEFKYYENDGEIGRHNDWLELKYTQTYSADARFVSILISWVIFRLFLKCTNVSLRLGHPEITCHVMGD